MHENLFADGYHHISYGKFTEAMGERPIILHPDGDLTLNYLDTRQFLLNQLQIATAAALVSRMIGEASDEETQQIPAGDARAIYWAIISGRL